jgi:SAM-dependent methyltransferase
MADAAHAHVWENTATYEAYMGRWSRPVAEAALAWLGLPPGLTWLDVGCGTGALTEVILEAADPREILGADPSGEFIATAAAQIADPRVRFAIGDARALPVPDDAYDVVVAGLVLHFVPDPQAAVVEMTRAAVTGGTVAAYVWDPTGEGQFTRPLWQAATMLDPAATTQDPIRHLSVCQPEPLAALFAGAGLRDVTVDAVVVPTVFRDFDDFWQPHLLGGSSPAQRYVTSLSADQRTALRERLQAMLPMGRFRCLDTCGRSAARSNPGPHSDKTGVLSD